MSTTPPPQPPRQSVPPPAGASRPFGAKNTKATVALVLGIVSLLCFNLVAGIPALIVGYLGYTEAENLDGVGKTQALIGMITGGIGTLWGLGVLFGRLL